MNLALNGPAANSRMFVEQATVEKWAQFIARQSKLSSLYLAYNELSDAARTCFEEAKPEACKTFQTYD